MFSKNILLIQASSNPNKSAYDRFLEDFSLMWPPSTLDYLATITPDKYNVDVLDENYEDLEIEKDYDLVGISFFTASAPRAYKIVDQVREEGKEVVLGGYHATALPEEAKEHGDSVVIGEGEESWKRLLRDFEKGELKSFYKSNQPVDIKKYSKPKRFSKKGVVPMGGVEATRGCPFGCEFCAVSNYPFGKIYRKKDVEDIKKEIEEMPFKSFVFYDSSLTVDKDYTKELFRAIKPLNKKFACFGHADVADDEELLKEASEAGCVAWDIGFESISQETINNLGKKSNKVEEYGKVVDKVHDYGMAVVGSFAFGFDEHGPDVFDSTIEAVKDFGIDSMGITILTPLPGTRLFDRIEKEGRILTKDWSKYNMYNVVFEPKKMTPEQLYNGTKRVANEFYSVKSILKRTFRSKDLGLFTMLGLGSHLATSRIIYKSEFGERLLG